MPTENIDSLIERKEKEFDEKYHYQNGVELLLKSPNHFQTYDVTAGIKSFLISSLKEGRDLGRAEVIEEVKEMIKDYNDTPWLLVRFPAHLVRFEGVDNGGIRFSGEVIDVEGELLKALEELK